MIITHIITCLGDGGAEALLYRICVADPANSHVVISLQDAGKYGPLLAQIGVATHCLGMPKGLLTPTGTWRLYALLKKVQPDAVQTWMYHADLVGGVIARLAGIKRVFWGLHNADLEPKSLNIRTRFVVRMNALLSGRIPARIISCSQRGAEVHQAFGYAARKLLVIPNGYNFSEFCPDSAAGNKLRAELGIPAKGFLLGMVGRYDPQKDHANLITALGALKARGLTFRCLLVGTGMTRANTPLVKALQAANIQDITALTGPRTDIPAVMNALNLHVLSSAFEAFPNVLCEAMACGTLCVSTNTGDSELILGDTGWATPPKSAHLLASAIEKAIGLHTTNPSLWQQQRIAARKRVCDQYSIDNAVAQYSLVWRGEAATQSTPHGNPGDLF